MGVANKKEHVKASVKKAHGCVGVCNKCALKFAMFDKMYDANVPAGYWDLRMERHFKGSEKLQEQYIEYSKNILKKYDDGESICFAGNQGTGKTMASICILREAMKRSLSAYYITASDLLSFMTDYKNSGPVREKLRSADFLVIDELDSRFFVSDSVKELFTGIYENLFRFRSHNNLPTIICTNETEGVLGIFYGAGRQSIESLHKQYLTVYPVIGQDFRKKQG